MGIFLFFKWQYTYVTNKLLLQQLETLQTLHFYKKKWIWTGDAWF